ncbi:hypothetical protein DRN32_06770 [Thermococci archaeon]|nr:MAG: hypothetical protein DRN32_06770 [Thermococci archaeon]
MRHDEIKRKLDELEGKITKISMEYSRLVETLNLLKDKIERVNSDFDALIKEALLILYLLKRDLDQD